MTLEILWDPTVKMIVGLAIIPLAVIVFTLALVYFLAAITRGRRDIEESEPFKGLRYESGNPMWGEARRKVSMQYFGYLVMFLALEPAVIILALALAASEALAANLIYLYLLLLGVYAPFLVYGIRESRRAESWMLGGEGEGRGG